MPWLCCLPTLSLFGMEYVHVGSETAVCEEDLRELRDEAEGVRLRSNRSSASFRLEVFNWDSEPES